MQALSSPPHSQEEPSWRETLHEICTTNLVNAPLHVKRFLQQLGERDSFALKVSERFLEIANGAPRNDTRPDFEAIALGFFLACHQSKELAVAVAREMISLLKKESIRKTERSTIHIATQDSPQEQQIDTSKITELTSFMDPVSELIFSMYRLSTTKNAHLKNMIIGVNKTDAESTYYVVEEVSSESAKPKEHILRLRKVEKPGNILPQIILVHIKVIRKGVYHITSCHFPSEHSGQIIKSDIRSDPEN